MNRPLPSRFRVENRLKYISREFRLKKRDERRNYFVEEIDQNELGRKRHYKFCTTLNYFEHFFILASAVTGFISIAISGFISIAAEFKICAITAATEKYMSIIKNKKEEA